MRQQGLPAIELIRAATINAAELIGVSKTSGSIKKGKIADLIAVYGDPLTDISALKKVNFVMQQGIIIKNAN